MQSAHQPIKVHAGREFLPYKQVPLEATSLSDDISCFGGPLQRAGCNQAKPAPPPEHPSSNLTDFISSLPAECPVGISLLSRGKLLSLPMPQHVEIHEEMMACYIISIARAIFI